MADNGPIPWSRCDYAAELENLDMLFEQVVGTIPAAERDNTLLCVSSDHGEMLFDHTDSGKTLPWQGSASVPLICQGLDVAVNKVRRAAIEALFLVPVTLFIV